MIFAFLTGTRVRWEDDSNEPIEEHGWVDVEWSMRELYEARNYVDTVIATSADSEDLEDVVLEALNLLPGGYEDNGDGTFCSVDSEMPFHDNEEGWTYTYALHFTRKILTSGGWAEVQWHPVRDGGLTI